MEERILGKLNGKLEEKKLRKKYLNEILNLRELNLELSAWKNNVKTTKTKLF